MIDDAFDGYSQLLVVPELDIVLIFFSSGQGTFTCLSRMMLGEIPRSWLGLASPTVAATTNNNETYLGRRYGLSL